MPFSSNSGKNYIRSIVGTPKTVLDIGAGCGTYKDMFCDMQNVHWTALEIWEPYVEKYGLRNKYDKVIVADVRDWEPEGTYDVCFCGDILEHMTAEQAAKVLEKLKACCDKVIVSIPLGHYPQDEYDGNPHEVHVEDNWSHEKVVETFGKPKQFHIENEIGVYVYQKIRIAVYAISKNEEEFVKRFCDSARDADLILIADTGSTDNTVSVAKESGAVVHEIAIMPWRFDKAREAALALVPRNIDICISLDLDEVLAPGWRAEIERLWEFGKTTRMRYQFDWSMGVKFFAEKIHARSGYHWHHPCHEYIRADKRTNEQFVSTDKLMVQHLPDPTKSRGQYMELLKNVC